MKFINRIVQCINRDQIQKHMEDFFSNGQEGETITYQQPTQPSSTNYQHESFSYQDNNQYTIPNSYQDNYSNDLQESETTRKIRQEEQRIQQSLKIKANHEYQDKQKRKQKAAKQLQEFMSNREKEKNDRKQQGIQAERELNKAKANENSQAPWRKVAANIKIKQGEYVGQKDVNRMREAIIRKKDDQN